MGNEEGHGGNSSGSSATVAQPSMSQSPMFHPIFPPQPLSLRPSGEVADNWKLWKEKYNNYFVISRLDRESSPYQLAMFKHTISDDALKVIKTFSYTEGEDSNNWRVVMAKMEKHCVGEVNEIYERYCFNKQDKLPTDSVDCFVAELKTMAKTCNFCDCLRDSLIRDTENLRSHLESVYRYLPQQRSHGIYMKSLSEPVDNVNQVKSKKKKPRVPTPDGQSRKKI